MALTLADLLAPITPERFFAEFYDRQPLHIRGGAAKFAQVLSWRGIDRLLDQTHIWSSQSLKLVLDGNAVPPDAYCTRATGRDGQPVQQPDSRKVRDWVARGTSVVMNDVDSLTPGLAAVSNALEEAGLGKAQANVYISFRSHKAFPAHFDTHDVWAVQVEGEKDWNIWSGRAEWPIAHPAFRNLGQAHHEQAKGALREKVKVKAGDLLYLPRGWYHDALAEADASVHVAYGVSPPMGLDLLSMLFERAIQDPLFRQPLPRQDGTPATQFALTTRAGQIGQRLAEFCREPKVLETLGRLVAEHRYHRGGNDLLAARGLAAPREAAAASGGEEPGFRVVAEGAKPVRRGAEWLLKGANGNLPLSPPEAEAAGWVLARRDVDEAGLRAAHPAVDAPALLRRLAEAGLLAAA
ncbi:cupin domain-containing protein [Roseomonas sp. OT10]|uniref:cupin domain-containing protein n=1 Tax=Roseomonas cutis TaxID=2897332 RepID=UPI001E460FFC|nr:cupin domain-containing protein [Roseomonas sp. OT10]UFN50513.1 cupin domain-containing protein [Roseomonas sp. OT10]